MGECKPQVHETGRKNSIQRTISHLSIGKLLSTYVLGRILGPKDVTRNRGEASVSYYIYLHCSLGGGGKHR